MSGSSGTITRFHHAGALSEVAAVAAEHARETDAAARFPAEAMAAMRRTGLLGLMVPAELGGSDGDAADLVDATIELGRADMSVAMIFAMHCQQVAAVARYGCDKLRRETLPAVAAGDVYLASVTTEPGKGGHLLTSESVTHAANGMIQIDRDAPIVTGGTVADAFLITTLTPGATSPAQVDLIYASREQLTVRALGGWQPLGMRATHSIPMWLSGAVPDWQVVGEPGEFRAIAAQVFAPLAHLGWSAAWLGAAAGALSRVVRHLRGAGRGQLDLGSGITQARLASARERLDVTNSLLRHTLSVVRAGGDLSAPATQLLLNTLKTRAADETFAAVNELIELVGLRHGYLTGSELWLERAFRDLRSASLNLGNDRLRLDNGSLALLDSEVRLA
jgi:acyl-CoA dehydrogenase